MYCDLEARRTVEDELCSKGDRMHLLASIAPGITIDKASDTLGKNFWLENDKTYRITTANKMSLQIELKDWSGKRVFAHYDVFKVNNEKNN